MLPVPSGLLLAVALPVFGLLLAIVLPAWSRDDSFEPVSFNATEALLDIGFHPAAIPDVRDAAVRAPGEACKAACASLSLAYGDHRILTGDELGYDNFTGAYWSQLQGDVNPQCIFKAPDAVAVSAVVLLSRLTQCPFAAKSGGHAAFAGASSIEGGITVSFEDMKKVEVSADKKIVSVEPGHTWGAVFEYLHDYEVAVVGGRVSGIGIGGLTTGGGTSFFSGLYGWACDNVAKYTLVTAIGTIIEVTPTRYPDLYWALRGGGNNFGLVVKFDMNLYPLPKGELWGGARVYTEPSFPGVIDAFTKVVTEATEDPNAGQWVAFLHAQGMKMASTEFWHAKSNSNASIFSGYDGLEAISDTTKVQSVPEYATELQKINPNGLRETYWTFSVKPDKNLASIAKDIFFEEFPAVADVAGSLPVFIFQGITEPMMEQMAKNGGNALGLDASDGPLILMLIACWWEDEEDDATVYEFASKVVSRVTEEVKARGLHDDYIYMNYASMFQDVITGYGKENQQRLQGIAEKYDPSQVFQKLQPGYFKLDNGAPVPDSGY